ncbi:MAG: class I SAM-dependent methyltransferase [Nitrospiraceae bacterium]
MAPNLSSSPAPSSLTQRSWERLAHAFEGEVCDIVAADRRGVIEWTIEGLRRDFSQSVLLDVGCGIGTFIRTYGPRFRSVYGSDFSRNMLTYAQRRCRGIRNVRWLQADLSRIDHATMPTGDLTVCLNVVTSPSKRIRTTMLQSLWKLTNPRGVALLVVPSLESTLFVHRTIKDGRLTGATKRTLLSRGVLMCDGVTQKYFSKPEILDSMRQAGFRKCIARRVWIPWSEEGLEEDHPRLNGKALPWDWLVLGHK